MLRRATQLFIRLACAACVLVLAALIVLWARSHRRIDRVSFVWRAEHSVAFARGQVHWFYSLDPDRTFPGRFDTGPLGSLHGSRNTPARKRMPPLDVFPGTVAATDRPLGIVTVEGKCTPCVFDLPDPAVGWAAPRTFAREVLRSRPKDSRIRYRNYHGVSVPVWPVASLVGAVPFAWLVAAIRGRRRKVAGCCPSCGYDLRATPDRCPECGTGVRTSPAAPSAPGSIGILAAR